jgi:hypothetical protein
MILMEKIEISLEKLKQIHNTESAEEVLAGLYKTLSASDMLATTGKDVHGNDLPINYIESFANIAEMTRELIIRVEKHIEGQGKK